MGSEISPGKSPAEEIGKAGIKISELSKKTGVSKQAIHFYLREGLLHPGEKTSHNMAYYDSSHVDRLNQVKTLQEKHRLKLSEIREILEGEPGGIENSAILLDIFAFLPDTDKHFTATELVKRSGLEKKELKELKAAGLIASSGEGKAERYGSVDLELTGLFNGIRSAGFSRDYCINVLTMFKEVSGQLAVREVENYFKSPRMGTDLETLGETFRLSDPFLEKAFWLFRRTALEQAAKRTLDDYGLFSWMTGRQFGHEASTVLPSVEYLEPLDLSEKVDSLKLPVGMKVSKAYYKIVMAFISYVRGDRVNQRRWATAALEIDSRDRWALLLLGDAHLYLLEPEQANEVLSSCVKLHPDFALAPCWQALSMLLMAAHEKTIEGVLFNITEALAKLNLSKGIPVSEDVEKMILLSVRGRTLFLLPDFMGVFEEAVSELKKAVKLGEKAKKRADDPYYLTAIDCVLMNSYYDLGRAAERAFNYGERDQYWRKLIEIDPANRIAPSLQEKMAANKKSH